MSDDPTQDAHSLSIALRLAHAQNRELRKQLATATEALEDVVNAGDSTVMYRTAKQALAAIKQNQGEQP